MPLTIVFNGTSDTYYPDDHSYLRANQLTGIGEGSHTLSFFADCIATLEVQKAEPLLSRVTDPGLLIKNNDLVVIQGPDDSGTGVHNLIVTGLMAVLNALMRGEQEISFVGFSRGSVEAVHTTHELQRIKDYLNDPSKDHSMQALVNFICEGCYNPGNWSTWRTNRIKSYYRNALITALHDPNALQALKNGLSNPDIKFRFNGMLLDPVPGFAEGTTLPSYVPWTSSQHTVIAPMVDELTVAYMSDELSVGFRAVWIEPAPESTTKVTHFHLPGYHGTANGNPVNHTPVATLAQSQNPFLYQNLRAVQKVYFYKLLQFAAKHGVRFRTPTHLEGRFLTPVYRHFLENISNNTAQNDYIREQYKAISTHLVHYRKTRETWYIPAVLGLGGAELEGGERIIMTKSGPRSLADCFSFDIKGASTYVNFDSFSLDFMTLLFPELTSPPSDSPNQHAMTYSGIHQIVTTRYASPTPEMGCIALITKIKGLLAACQSHALENDLNKIILHHALDHNGILSNLVNLVPAKLTDMFFSSNLSVSDKIHIQEVIEKIINFELVTLSEQEQSDYHANLFIKKSTYIKTFKANMHTAIINQTRKTLANLLEGQEQLHYRALYPADSGFDVWDYLAEAEQYYHVLQEFRTKLQFSGMYLSKEEQQHLHYKIDEAITQFPTACERVLSKHGVVWQQNMLNFSVLQPWFEKLVQQEAIEKLSNKITQRDTEFMKLLVKNRDLQHQIRDMQNHLSRTQADLATKEEQLQNQIQLNITQRTAGEEELRTKQERFTNLQRQMQIIRDTLQSRQPSDYHGFTLQILGSLTMLLGMIIAVISASYLILGTAGLAAPIAGLIAGSGLATLGVFNFHRGTLRQHNQVLAETFFPTVLGAR